MKKIILVIFTILLIPFQVRAAETKYLGMGSTNKIIIRANENNIEALINQNSIEIENLESYHNIFLNEDKDNYPIYILQQDNVYKFSDTNTRGKVFLDINRYGQIIAFENNTNLVNNCEGIFGVDFINFLKSNVFKTIYIAIPIVLLVLTSFDFFKLIFSDTKDGLSGAFQKLAKRIIAVIFIFLTPNILIFIIEMVGFSDIRSCVDTFKTVETIEK